MDLPRMPRTTSVGRWSVSPGRVGFMRRTLPALAVGAVLAAAACLPDDQRTDSIEPGVSGRAELSAETLAQIDSGNAAFRRDDFETAIARFEEVTRSAPDDPTGWFGLYMAHVITKAHGGSLSHTSERMSRVESDKAPHRVRFTLTLPTQWRA